MFVGFNLTFLVQHSLGTLGMPRRIYWYPESADWGLLNLLSTIGAYILGIGVLITIVNVIVSIKKGRKAGNDPWKGNTLEWFTQSPPPENNFDVIPRVRSVEPMKDIRREVLRGAGEPEGSVAQPVAPGT
jgi:cytochrome c oxidase subunit 1